MLVTAGGRRVMINGKMQNLSSNPILNFEVKGEIFPKSNYSPGTALGATYLRVTSSSLNNAVTINYGDGNIITYNFTGVIFDIRTLSNGTHPAHTYTDSNTGSRIISIKFKNYNDILDISFQYNNLYGVLPSSISSLKTLRRLFVSQSKLTVIPEQITNNINLEEINFNDVGTAISERIPITFLNSSLKTLAVGRSVDMSDIYASNLYNLSDYPIADTLEYLNIEGNNITILPNNMVNLIKLETLICGGGNKFIQPPSVLGGIVSLKSLNYGGNRVASPLLKTHLDISNLLNLEYLIVSDTVNLETNLPIGIENCKALKIIDVKRTYATQVKLDLFVDNVYNFIEAEASKTSGNTQFRQMSINISLVPNQPSGTYQQPANYIQGVSNGDPASPLEKIWVMVNQYEHTWTY